MSLSPRAIATLGVGFGAVSIAYLGLWPVSTPVEPTPEPSYRPRGAAPFVLDYTPELRDILARLAAVETSDSARIVLEALAAGRARLVAVEAADQATSRATVLLAAHVAATETPDSAVGRITVDWSDDDREIEEMMAALLS